LVKIQGELLQLYNGKIAKMTLPEGVDGLITGYLNKIYELVDIGLPAVVIKEKIDEAFNSVDDTQTRSSILSLVTSFMEEYMYILKCLLYRYMLNKYIIVSRQAVSRYTGTTPDREVNYFQTLMDYIDADASEYDHARDSQKILSALEHDDDEYISKLMEHAELLEFIAKRRDDPTATGLIYRLHPHLQCFIVIMVTCYKTKKVDGVDEAFIARRDKKFSLLLRNENENTHSIIRVLDTINNTYTDQNKELFLNWNPNTVSDSVSVLLQGDVMDASHDLPSP
jgi:hypothetical protein